MWAGEKGVGAVDAATEQVIILLGTSRHHPAGRGVQAGDSSLIFSWGSSPAVLEW